MASHTHGQKDDEGQSASTAYETRDVKIRPLVVFIAGLVAVGLVTYLVVFLLFRMYSAQATKQDVLLEPVAGTRPPVQAGEEHLPPEPRVQANPAADLKILHDQEDAILTTYGWVDRSAGVVRVPIDVAIERVLEQGLPVRQPASAPPATGTPALPAAPQGRPHAAKVSK